MEDPISKTKTKTKTEQNQKINKKGHLSYLLCRGKWGKAMRGKWRKDHIPPVQGYTVDWMLSSEKASSGTKSTTVTALGCSRNGLHAATLNELVNSLRYLLLDSLICLGF